ncbi:MAG: hypothetical protein ACI8X5_002828 [Planctomycetota bacterium]|jgi:hypothetical protein
MILLNLLLSATASPPQVTESYEPPMPTAQNRTAWQTYILPSAEETQHESIPWLPTFGEGILAAQAQQKPLLLWTMNGHPLGCT